jgi:hypothetical protein
MLLGAGVAVPLPYLNIMERCARAAAPKKRFVVVYTMNASGFIRNGRSVAMPMPGTFDLPGELKPLEPHKSDLTTIWALDNLAGDTGNRSHHAAALSTLTGAEVIPNGALSNPDGDAFWGFGGISLDQELAGKLGSLTKLKSLELSTGGAGNGIEEYLSASGRDKAVPSLRDPKAIHSRLFANFTPPTPGQPAPTQPAEDKALLALLARRKSVLDAVRADYSRLQKLVGHDDRQRLEEHLTSIFEMEKTFQAPGGGAGGGAAGAPTASCTNAAGDAGASFQTLPKIHLDYVAKAFACDLTRIATSYWTTSSVTFSWLGHSHRQHAFAHNSGDYNWSKNDAGAEKGIREIEAWCAQQIADFVTKLKNTPEGPNGGTVWDNTLLLWNHELSKGSHSHTDHSYVLLGNIDRRFKTGRHLETQGHSNNDLYVTILNAFGIPVTSFGTPKFNTTPLNLG